MNSDITIAHIHGLLENFSKYLYRAKDSDQGSLVSIALNSEYNLCVCWFLIYNIIIITGEWK